MPDMDIMGPKEAMLSWTLETNTKNFKPAHPIVESCFITTTTWISCQKIDATWVTKKGMRGSNTMDNSATTTTRLRNLATIP